MFVIQIDTNSVLSEWDLNVWFILQLRDFKLIGAGVEGQEILSFFWNDRCDVHFVKCVQI